MEFPHSKFSICLLFCVSLSIIQASVLHSIEPVRKSVECPPPSAIFPCICAANFGGSIECSGSGVSQENLSNLFSQLRQVNKLTGPSDWLSLSRFTLTNTDLTEFDLSPLFRTKFERYIHIWDNCRLWKIFGSPGFPDSRVAEVKNQDKASIQVDQLICTENLLLNDTGLSDMMYHFDPLHLKKLTLGSSRIQGSQVKFDRDGELVSHVEFLPGLSAFTNLEEIDLNRNEIRKIVGGQFAGNSKLQILNLERNSIKELGRDAFFFEETPSSLREINLSDNKLKNERVDPRSGIRNLKGAPPNSVTIKLTGNQFEFISADNFEAFIQGNMKNVLELWDNPLVCDLRMRWVKEGREKFEYEKRVKGMGCKNDRMKTPFTTDSIY